MMKDLREVEFQLAMVRQELEEQKKLVESLKKQIKNWELACNCFVIHTVIDVPLLRDTVYCTAIYYDKYLLGS